MIFGPEPPRCEYCGLRWGVHIALGCPDPHPNEVQWIEDDQADSYNEEAE